MKLYSALIKKNDEGKISDMIFLKDGFCYKAFLFSGLWFLYHKMWKEFAVLIATNCALSLLIDFNFISDIDQILLNIALMFLIGFNANKWLFENLKEKGYKFSGAVLEKSCIDAKIHFVKDYANLSLDEFSTRYFEVL